MLQKKKILWVEDGSRYDLVELTAPVLMDGNYDLDTAESISEGIACLLKKKYAVIIVDIRIPPGDDEEWVKLYQKSAKDKISARLGLQFLFSILGHSDAKVVLKNRPEWIRREMIGVLSVEGHQELNGDLDKLGISCYVQKEENTSELILLTMIHTILNQVDLDESQVQS
jgi:hypothetical protein